MNNVMKHRCASCIGAQTVFLAKFDLLVEEGIAIVDGKPNLGRLALEYNQSAPRRCTEMVDSIAPCLIPDYAAQLNSESVAIS